MHSRSLRLCRVDSKSSQRYVAGMKTLKIVFVVSLLLTSTLAGAAAYKNNKNEQIVVKLRSGKTLIIPPKGTVQVSDKDFSPELGYYVVSGDVTAIETKNHPPKRP